MKKNSMVIIAFVGLILMYFVACTANVGKEASVAVTQDSLVKRGGYLVTISGCNDCHSPKKMGANGPELDSLQLMAGHLANSAVPPTGANAGKNGWVLMSMDQTVTVGPWGTSYAANISSDSTGIGNWTEAQFNIAMRKGKSKGIETARTLLPPMPWESFAHFSEPDMHAIFAYLKNTKPISNVVPAAIGSSQ